MSRTTSVILSPHEDREARVAILRAEIDAGIEQLDRGEYTDWRRLKEELDAGFHRFTNG